MTGPAKKRTRLNVHQSKNGCITCKTRRVKCDEAKPICLRCNHSRRLCAGYVTASTAPGVSSYESLSMTNITNSRILVPIRMAPQTSFSSSREASEHHHFASLARLVLEYDVYGEDYALAGEFRSHFLPQLCSGNPVVSAAATAFGAVYNSRLLMQDKSAAEVTATTLYKSALQYLGKDLFEQKSGPSPPVVACILLACAETLWRHPQNALVHLQGAIKIVSMRRVLMESQVSSASSSSSSENTQCGGVTKADGDLSTMLRSLDLQSATFAMASSAELSPPNSNMDDELSRSFGSVSAASALLVNLLHNSYHFIASASSWKYMPPASVSRELSFEQGRHISRLSLWLKHLEDHILNSQTSSTSLSAKSCRHVYMIRAQCLTGLIHTSTVLSPYETTYDRYASYFQQIVISAEKVLEPALAAPKSILAFFRPGLGIIQPLLFTALKYRHSCWRRKAIALLELTGMEGPWVGSIESVVCKRAMQLEEASVRSSSNADESMDVYPEQIAEAKRVCGMNVPVEGNGAFRDDGMVTISVSRCVDVEFMISGAVSFEDKQHWQIWEEDIFVGSIVPPNFHNTV